jgi:cation:H+ antiporter
VSPNAHPGRPHRRVAHPRASAPYQARSTRYLVAIFVACSAATLGAGVVLADAGSQLVSRAATNGVSFRATVLAAVTALPEISSGIAAVKLGGYQLAFGDIFGGKGFPGLPVSHRRPRKRPALPHQGAANSWRGGPGLILTAVYAAGSIGRPTVIRARPGIDSWIVLLAYAAGIAGLAAVAQ